jgi:RES domain-containing protein
MDVYRISRLKWAKDREGSGIAARWNRTGSRMLYTASSIALALLEILVHVRKDQIPDDYVWIKAHLPEILSIEIVEQVPESPADYGTMWLNSARSPVLSVPSVIVPERNYLLNPGHADFAHIDWFAAQKLQIDSRLTGLGTAAAAGSSLG